MTNLATDGLGDLLARAEGATGRDNALATDIYNALGDQAMDRGKLGWTWRPGGRGMWHNLPDLCSSLDAALELVARALPDANCHGYDLTPSGVDAYVSRNSVASGHWLKEGRAATPALALLAALLKALSEPRSSEAASPVSADPG